VKKRIENRVENAIRFVNDHRWLQGIIGWLKTNSFPGLKRIPIYNLLIFIRAELKNDALMTRANSMAFDFFLAIFPSIIVLFTLLAYTPLYDNFDDVLQQAIQEIMPGSAGQVLFKAIEDIATIPRSGLLSFGFFLAMWFASNGMLSMLAGLEKEYQLTFKRRTGFEKRLISIQLTFYLAFILVASVVFVILGNILLKFLFNYIDADWITRMFLFAFRWISVTFLFYAGFSIIYRYGTPLLRKTHFFSPGALLATVLAMLASWGFSFYVNNFGSYNKLYGSIGAIIVLMVWLQLNCVILLIGFELNAGIAVLQDLRKVEALEKDIENTEPVGLKPK